MTPDKPVWQPSVWQCLGYVTAFVACLAVAGTFLIWWGGNHPGGIVDRIASMFRGPSWMGEDR